MLTLAKAEHSKAYVVEDIQVEDATKKHLNNLGLVLGATIALINDSGENSIVLLQNSRIAMNKSILNHILIAEKDESIEKWVSLDQLSAGENAQVVGVHGQGAVRRRLMDMGITKGVDILVRKRAPLGDPIEINLRGYELTLRNSEAGLVLVKKEGET